MFLHGKKYRWFVGVLAAALLSSCSFHDLHQAQSIVKQADSLRAEGQMYSDSLTLAQACETLGKSSLLSIFNYQLSTDYAHACYHYGWLLREKDDPVSAMQAFINATHTRTRDSHILGRVYSNMGDICHHADEFSLSYDMFKRSAEMFLRDGDSLAYYYALNDMAFEKVMLADKEATFSLLKQIEQECDDLPVLTKLLETKAEWHLRAHQYDSAIYYADQLLKIRQNEPTGLLIKAQAYSYLNIKDSAVYYAAILQNFSSSLYEKCNALYILTNDDDTQSIDSIREVAANRADTQKLIETARSKLAQASQLLEQDLHRRPNFTWLYAIIATLVIIGTAIGIYVAVKRKKHRLLSQQIYDLEAKNNDTIEQKRARVEAHCLLFIQSKDLKKDLCWNDYEKMCDVINHYFYLLAKKLQLDYSLSEREVRLCVLSLLDFGYDRMADLLFYAPNGVGKFKMRVAKKLGTTAKNLRQFLIRKATDK